MKKPQYCLAFGVLYFIGIFFVPLSALANITITPTRVVFEDRDRFSEVTLVNTGKEQETYDIEWRFFRMIEGPDSAYTQTQSSVTEFDLTKYIVYTPRRVTLAPGAKQKIRLALRRPAEVPPGEYRAHLSFRQLKDEKINSNTATPTQPNAVSAGVIINLAYSIPVIFRAGTPNVQASIDNLSLQRNQKSGKLDAIVTMGRSGEPYGVLGYLYLYNDAGDVIGEISNAHIFPEVDRRIIRVPLSQELKSGDSIKAVLMDYTKAPDKIYAQRIFPVQ